MRECLQRSTADFYHRIFSELNPTLDQIRSNFLGSVNIGIGNNSIIRHVLWLLNAVALQQKNVISEDIYVR